MGLKPDQIFQKVCFMNWMNGVWKTEKKVFKKHNQYYIWPFVHLKKKVFVNGFDGVLLLQEKKSFGYFQLPDQHDQVYNDSFLLGKVITWG